MRPKNLVAIALAGGAKAGKKSLSRRYCNGEGPKIHYVASVGADFHIKQPTEVHGITTQVWLVPSRVHKYNPFGIELHSSTLFKNVEGVILCFDLTSQASFDEVESFLDDAKQHQNPLKIILAGTHADKQDERVVSSDDIQHFCQKHNLPYFETSAVTGAGVNEAFAKVTDMISGQDEQHIQIQEDAYTYKALRDYVARVSDEASALSSRRASHQRQLKMSKLDAARDILRFIEKFKTQYLRPPSSSTIYLYIEACMPKKHLPALQPGKLSRRLADIIEKLEPAEKSVIEAAVPQFAVIGYDLSVETILKARLNSARGLNDSALDPAHNGVHLYEALRRYKKQEQPKLDALLKSTSPRDARSAARKRAKIKCVRDLGRFIKQTFLDRGCTPSLDDVLRKYNRTDSSQRDIIEAGRTSQLAKLFGQLRKAHAARQESPTPPGL